MYLKIQDTAIETTPSETFNGGWTTLLKLLLLLLSYLNKTNDSDILLYICQSSPARAGDEVCASLLVGYSHAVALARSGQKQARERLRAAELRFLAIFSFFLLVSVPWHFLVNTALFYVLQRVRHLSRKFWCSYSVVIEVSLAWCFVTKSEECKNGVSLRLAAFTRQRFKRSLGCKFDLHTMRLTYIQMRF